MRNMKNFFNLFFPYFTGEDIQNIINTCCQLGSNATHISECEDTSLEGIPPTYESFCLTTKHLCCSHVVRQTECGKGIELAKAGRSCMEGFSRGKEACTSDFRVVSVFVIFYIFIYL